MTRGVIGARKDPRRRPYTGRPRHHHRRRLLAAVALVSVGGALGACGAKRASLAAVTAHYEASAIVLEDATHGPELCLAGVLTSNPPQCGGTPVAGLEWSKVPRVSTANGTTWADVHVV